MPFFDNLIVAYFLGPSCVTQYKRRYALIMFILFLFNYLYIANVCIETKITIYVQQYKSYEA